MVTKTRNSQFDHMCGEGQVVDTDWRGAGSSHPSLSSSTPYCHDVTGLDGGFTGGKQRKSRSSLWRSNS